MMNIKKATAIIASLFIIGVNCPSASAFVLPSETGVIADKEDVMTTTKTPVSAVTTVIETVESEPISETVVPDITYYVEENPEIVTGSVSQGPNSVDAISDGNTYTVSEEEGSTASVENGQSSIDKITEEIDMPSMFVESNLNTFKIEEQEETPEMYAYVTYAETLPETEATTKRHRNEEDEDETVSSYDEIQITFFQPGEAIPEETYEITSATEITESFTEISTETEPTKEIYENPPEDDTVKEIVKTGVDAPISGIGKFSIIFLMLAGVIAMIAVAFKDEK